MPSRCGGCDHGMAQAGSDFCYACIGANKNDPEMLQNRIDNALESLGNLDATLNGIESKELHVRAAKNVSRYIRRILEGDE